MKCRLTRRVWSCENSFLGRIESFRRIYVETFHLAPPILPVDLVLWVNCIFLGEFHGSKAAVRDNPRQRFEIPGELMSSLHSKHLIADKCPSRERRRTPT